MAVYENVVADLQRLQDRLTQEKRLSNASEVRAAREEIGRAWELLKNPPESKRDDSAPASIFEPIPEDRKIFSLTDPRIPGDLVLLGMLKGSEVPQPSNADRKRIISVSAGPHGWFAINDRGKPICDSSIPHMQMKSIDSRVRNLKTGIVGDHIVVINDKGEVQALGVDPNDKSKGRAGVYQGEICFREDEWSRPKQCSSSE